MKLGIASWGIALLGFTANSPAAMAKSQTKLAEALMTSANSAVISTHPPTSLGKASGFST